MYERLLGRTPSEPEVSGQVTATQDWRVLLGAMIDSSEYRAAHSSPGNEPSRASATRINAWHPDSAGFTQPPGTWSHDDKAVMGDEGWIYLARGSNSVADQYRPGFELADGWGEEWADVVKTRRNEAAAVGATLLLLIVPDKLSAIRDHVPHALGLSADGPAARLADDLGIMYPVDELSRVEGGAFLRTDTHLSLAGNEALAGLLLDQLRPGTATDLDGLSVHRHCGSGDLGITFDPPVVEVISTYNSFGRAVVVEDNRERVQAAGRHVGTRRVLHNADAPDRRRVVIFGDSYAFPAAQYQSIAWYFAQHFLEVHFIWAPFGWDADYVRDVDADVVLCEMAERFVPRAPAERIDVATLVADGEGGQ